MSDDTYNGWTNYETWNWKLWMDNDGDDRRWDEEIGNLKDRHADGRIVDLIWDLSKALEADKDEWMEMGRVAVTGPFADILGAGLSRINWYEIAEHLVEDYE
jgi:hypothetical protein